MLKTLRTLTFSVLIVLLGQAISRLSTLIFRLFLARELDPMDYGRYALFVSVFATAFLFASFKIDLTNLVFLSKNKDKSSNKMTSFSINSLYSVTPLLILSSFLVILVPFHNIFDNFNIIFLIFLAFFLYTFSLLSKGIFQSRKNFYNSSLIDAITGFSRLFLALFILFFIQKLTLDLSISIFLIGFILSGLLSIYLLGKDFFTNIDFSFRKDLVTLFYHNSFWFSVSYLSIRLILLSPLLIVIDISEGDYLIVAIFDIAILLLQVSNLILISIPMVVIPYLSSEKERKDISNLLSLEPLMIALSISLFTIFIFWFTNLVPSVLTSFGLDETYQSSISIFKILSLAIPFQFISYILHSALISKNKIRATSLCDLYSLFFALFSYYIFYYSNISWDGEFIYNLHNGTWYEDPNYELHLVGDNLIGNSSDLILASVVTGSLILRFILLSGLYYRSR